MGVNTFGGGIRIDRNFMGRSNVGGTALEGMAVKSSYLVRGINGFVGGCAVNSSYCVSGVSAVRAARNTAFNRKGLIDILGRIKRKGIVLFSSLGDRLTTFVIGRFSSGRLGRGVQLLVGASVRGGTPREKRVNDGIGVIGAGRVAGYMVGSLYRMGNTSQLDSYALLNSIRNGMCVNAKIVVRGSVVTRNSDIVGDIGVRSYFIKRTYRLDGNFATSTSMFFTGDCVDGNRTYTTFYNPFATSRRGDDLLVNKVFSFCGTNSTAGFDGRTCGVNPVR